MNILELPHFISDDQCDEIIALFHSEKENQERWVGSLNVHLESKDLKELGIGDRVYMLAKQMSGLVQEVDTCNIACFPDGKGMQAHTDYPWDAFGFVIYLNDDFDGGETFFELDELKTISPEKGKMIIFPGNTVVHGVNTVHNGDRYTVSGWIEDPTLSPPEGDPWWSGAWPDYNLYCDDFGLGNKIPWSPPTKIPDKWPEGYDPETNTFTKPE